MAENNPWTKIKSKVAYESDFIRVVDHDVLNPAGNPWKYGVVEFKRVAVGVIPIDQEGNTYLVGQYRCPIEKYTWEIPEGGSEHGEDTKETALRELKEETGITAHSIELILEMDLSNAGTDERAEIFVARDLEFGESSPEESEELKIKKVSINELFRLVATGEVRDSLSVAGALKLFYDQNQ